MQVTVTGKQLDVGDSLRSHAEAATSAIADKYLGRAIEAHVVFGRERHLFLSDISLHAWRGLTVQCHGEAADAYAAFDDAALRLEKQLRRYKRRLRARHKGGKAGEEAAAPPESATDYVLAAEPRCLIARDVDTHDACYVPIELKLASDTSSNGKYPSHI